MECNRAWGREGGRKSALASLKLHNMEVQDKLIVMKCETSFCAGVNSKL